MIQDLTARAYAEYAAIMDPSGWAGLEHALRHALASNEPMERIVADDGERLIGSVLLYPAGARAYGELTGPSPVPEVRLLSVPPEARGQGVAGALMMECIRRARLSGSDALGIHTSSSMRVAMQMYERMGFVRLPADDFQPDGTEMVEAFRLPLSVAEARS